MERTMIMRDLKDGREGSHAEDITMKLKNYKNRLEEIKEEISFKEYLDKVIANPNLAALAHERIFNMIMSHGLDEDGNYRFFDNELFGLEEQLKAVVDYFNSSAKRMDTRKRVFMLHGPVSSAKSTMVDLIKKGLEEYSMTDEGALYGIKGCPMQEEPLQTRYPAKALRGRLMEKA